MVPAGEMGAFAVDDEKVVLLEAILITSLLRQHHDLAPPARLARHPSTIIRHGPVNVIVRRWR